MRRLGNLMVDQGVEQFKFTTADENQIRSGVMNMAEGTGLEAKASEIADNIVDAITNEALQPILIGQELLWLSEVIPDAAAGNWNVMKQQALFSGKWPRTDWAI